jgi:hypothetical protein
MVPSLQCASFVFTLGIMCFTSRHALTYSQLESIVLFQQPCPTLIIPLNLLPGFSLVGDGVIASEARIDMGRLCCDKPRQHVSEWSNQR